MSTFASSELIVNTDGSIYHLNLLPDDIADTIITVGDPERVKTVSDRFDEVEIRKQKREFVTHTGRLGKKRISVISTGIGPDNIDIVLNELDALASIDLQDRKALVNPRELTFIRLGTSGTLQKEIDTGSLVFSAFAMGLDNLMHFYPYQASVDSIELEKELAAFIDTHQLAIPVKPYAAQADSSVLESIGEGFQQGITLTAPGFYAPQGRRLRGGSLLSASTLQDLGQFSWRDLSITNFEMETAAIYGLSHLLGHRALSCSVILANRASGKFSKDPHQEVEDMIDLILGRWSDQ